MRVIVSINEVQLLKSKGWQFFTILILLWPKLEWFWSWVESLPGLDSGKRKFVEYVAIQE